MNALESTILPHLQDYPIYMALFTDVTNADFLRQQLLNGNTAFEYAFLDASLIASTSQLHAACFKAINDMRHERLRTRNVHSEIVFGMSPNNNITESFRRFGLSEKTKNLIAIKVRVDSGITTESVTAHLDENVKGTRVPLTDAALMKTRDCAAIEKVYKITIKPDDGPNSNAVSFILGSMAIKGT